MTTLGAAAEVVQELYSKTYHWCGGNSASVFHMTVPRAGEAEATDHRVQSMRADILNKGESNT